MKILIILSAILQSAGAVIDNIRLLEPPDTQSIVMKCGQFSLQERFFSSFKIQWKSQSNK